MQLTSVLGITLISLDNLTLIAISVPHSLWLWGFFFIEKLTQQLN